MDADLIISKNIERNKKLRTYYNPVSGKGSLIERFELKLPTGTIYMPNVAKKILPQRLIDDIDSYCKKYKVQRKQVCDFVEKVRLCTDFEYYSATQLYIKDKQTAKDVLFVLNNPQQKVHKIVHDKLFAGEPIRIDILKARKWGGSTYVAMLFFWIQNLLKKGWNSVIVGHVENQARNIRAMYNLSADKYQLADVKLTPFEGSNKTRYIKNRDCTISIGSMQEPDALRSGTTYLQHMSEVGLWKATPNRKPEDFIQTLLEMTQYLPYTCIFMESTAKGVGGYFHKAWLQSKKGNSNYTPIFISWFEDVGNWKELGMSEYEFIKNMNDYDWVMWNAGATLEGINWYNQKLKDYEGNHWRMMAENPTTDIEAFQSSGTPVFRLIDIQKARINNIPPMFIGNIVADGNKGVDAVNNIRFEENSKGDLKIWAFCDNENKIGYRYVVSVDIGGRSDGADFSTIRVIDRYPLMLGGVPEAILTYRGHIDHDLLAWKSVQVATHYDNAILVIESNTLDSKTSEGDHSLSLLSEIANFYNNLYARTDIEKIKQGAPIKYGFHTNRRTKPQLIANLIASFRDEDYIEYDGEVCDEAANYEVKNNGTYGAVDGQHDDLLMATAIGLLVSSEMRLPYRIKDTSARPTRIVKQVATR